MRRLAKVVAALLVFVPRVGLALDPPSWVAYDCDGFENPRQCFHDVDDDGCFGAGDQVVQSALQGSAALLGGFVCPPGTPPINVVGTGVSFERWSASGHVRFHETVINLGRDALLQIIAGLEASGRLSLDGVKIRGAEGSAFAGGAVGGSIHFGGSARFPARGRPVDTLVFSLQALNRFGGEPSRLTIADDSKITAGAIVLWVGDGASGSSSPDVSVSLGNGVELRAFGMLGNALRDVDVLVENTEAGGIEAERFTAKAPGRIEIGSDGPIALRRGSRFRANGTDGELVVESDSGAIAIDRIVAHVESAVRIAGASVRIGAMEDAETRRSTLRVGNARPREAVIESTGSIDLERMGIKAHAVEVTTAGTGLDLRHSRVRGRSGASTVTVSTGLGSTCDFTGSRFVRTTLSEDCGSVIGP